VDLLAKVRLSRQQAFILIHVEHQSTARSDPAEKEIIMNFVNEWEEAGTWAGANSLSKTT
jgi:hypothetical protein